MKVQVLLEARRGLGMSWRWELLVVVSHSIWVLGTTLGSYARAGWSLAAEPSPQAHFLNVKNWLNYAVLQDFHYS